MAYDYKPRFTHRTAAATSLLLHHSLCWLAPRIFLVTHEAAATRASSRFPMALSPYLWRWTLPHLLVQRIHTDDSMSAMHQQLAARLRLAAVCHQAVVAAKPLAASRLP